MKTAVADFSKITCILRGYTAQETRLILEVLKDSGIRSVEITMNTEGALSMIREAVERFGDSLSIGAGTVLTMEQLHDVVSAGADFVLSPVMFTREMLGYCQERKVIAVPAAFTPSEIYTQLTWGYRGAVLFQAAGWPAGSAAAHGGGRRERRECAGVHKVRLSLSGSRLRHVPARRCEPRGCKTAAGGCGGF